MENEHRAAVERALDALNAGDLDGYLELYDPTVTAHGYAPEPIGMDGLRAFYEGLATAFPDLHVTLEQTLEEGDLLMGRYIFRGTHEAEFFGVPRTGRQVAMSGQTTLRFADGKVVERWQIADVLGLLVQLGAIPAPA